MPRSSRLSRAAFCSSIFWKPVRFRFLSRRSGASGWAQAPDGEHIPESDSSGSRISSIGSAACSICCVPRADDIRPAWGHPRQRLLLAGEPDGMGGKLATGRKRRQACSGGHPAGLGRPETPARRSRGANCHQGKMGRAIRRSTPGDRLHRHRHGRMNLRHTLNDRLLTNAEMRAGNHGPNSRIDSPPRKPRKQRVDRAVIAKLWVTMTAL